MSNYFQQESVTQPQAVAASNGDLIAVIMASDDGRARLDPEIDDCPGDVVFDSDAVEIVAAELAGDNPPSSFGAAGSARPQNHPHGKTGGSLRHPALSVKENPENTKVSEEQVSDNAVADSAETGDNPDECATNHPPLSGAGKKPRRSRARETSLEMQGFMGQWFFDWCSLTIPNGLDGKGTRRRSPPDFRDRAEDAAGEAEAKAARDRLTLWCVTQGLRKIYLRRGTDGFRAGLNYGANPADTERLATIRDGHAINMPALEIPGGGGACAELAPAALALLGPVNAARIDVSWDHTRAGFFDDLHAYAMTHAGKGRPEIMDKGAGRTMTWDRGETMVKVYEKSLEQHAKGRLIGPPDPRKVRIEFRFMPKDAADKAGFARLARDEGPAGLLASTLWIRRMVEWVAAHTEFVDSPDAAVIGPSRVIRMPVVRTIEDRARYGMKISAPTGCMAALDQIVREQHCGDWLAAKVDPWAVHALAVSSYSEWIINTRAHEYAVSIAGVDQARTIAEEAERNADELDLWMLRQDAEDAAAQSLLADAHARAIDAGVAERVFDDELGAAVAEVVADAASEAVADAVDLMRERMDAIRSADVADVQKMRVDLDEYRAYLDDRAHDLAVHQYACGTA